jgi:hypothetical protein
MKTWILMAASSGAALFLFDSATREVRLSRRIQHATAGGWRGGMKASSVFARYLAREMDAACDGDRRARLALFAESDVLEQILGSLGEGTKEAVVHALKVPALADEFKDPLFPESSWTATRILRAVSGNMSA